MKKKKSEIPYPYDIQECVTFHPETRKWIAMYSGWQMGYNKDASVGCGTDTFDSYDDALAYIIADCKSSEKYLITTYTK